MAAKDFAQIGEDWIAATLEHRPEGATRIGVHEHDDRLGDRSRASVEARAAQLRSSLEALGGINASTLSREEQADHELLRRRTEWELVTIEELETWRHSPGGYLGAIGGGLNGLIIRNFAPLEERTRSLVSRLKQVPEALDHGRTNLDDCPRVHVETAMEQAAGLKILFERDLPDALSDLGNAALKSEFDEAVSAASSAMDSFAGWLKDDLLPRSDGDFRYGEERFKKLLSLADFVDRPLDELEKRGRDDLEATQATLAELAGQIDNSKSPAEVVDEISRDHPTPERLIPDTAALLEELRQFSIDTGMGSMPTEVRIEVTDTPAFARSTTAAACSTPGAFEKVATEAYYYVTPPDPAWPAERTEAYLKFFNKYSLPGITAHEAYPGHYVHISWLRQAPARLPHFLLTTTATEGWAHYIEQVLVEEGYGDGDPRYQIMQLREALLRICRYLCSFGLHTQDWSVDQAIEFFEREGYATRPIAEREARRGVMGPGYYAYTLGKHEILSLREKLKAKQGADYDQLAFHDAFMKLPYPVSIIESMLASPKD
ncbi:MAG: DUF885 domain-containing protein [Chloroflexi bacterium]|nr:DUF885 domain-containing protein [Chloroflexota bacterium]